MEIREAVEADIPAIVSLLKMSLGESLLPKSEQYWRWKHIDNPFGASPVLIAVTDHQLVGVRAFMRWAWSSSKGRVESVRAVDTATHPDFQGKGIFSKLTKALLDESKKKKYQLVFNTPNSKSMPGYLKMGWEKAGKLPVSLNIVSPIKMLANLAVKNNQPLVQKKENDLSYFLSHKNLPSLVEICQKTSSAKFTTAHTVSSLKWRYQDVPIGQYYAAGIERQHILESVIFYRIKHSRMGRELRVTDAFVSSPGSHKELKAILKNKIHDHNADYVTFGALTNLNFLKSLFSVDQQLLSPIVTVRQIQDIELDDFRKFNQWAPSLGDLELF
jgi:N-acetylglutamate synthase-like GNAT family acetyltransferase